MKKTKSRSQSGKGNLVLAIRSSASSEFAKSYCISYCTAPFSSKKFFAKFTKWGKDRHACARWPHQTDEFASRILDQQK